VNPSKSPSSSGRKPRRFSSPSKEARTGDGRSIAVSSCASIGCFAKIADEHLGVGTLGRVRSLRARHGGFDLSVEDVDGVPGDHWVHLVNLGSRRRPNLSQVAQLGIAGFAGSTTRPAPPSPSSPSPLRSSPPKAAGLPAASSSTSSPSRCSFSATSSSAQVEAYRPSTPSFSSTSSGRISRPSNTAQWIRNTSRCPT
jgi:hypothetical protein